eukprot:1616704-Rhodomonas_salina.3
MLAVRLVLAGVLRWGMRRGRGRRAVAERHRRQCTGAKRSMPCPVLPERTAPPRQVRGWRSARHRVRRAAVPAYGACLTEGERCCAC